MKHKFHVHMYYRYLKECEGKTFSSKDMVAFVRSINPRANPDSIKREHRNMKQNGELDYVCYLPEEGMYKVLPFRGSARLVQLDVEALEEQVA